MALAEVFLSAFLQVLFDKLASREFLEFVCGEGLRSKLNKLRQNFEMIQAVLSDAEEKQLTQNSVKIWLANLQNLAYDMEDLLDEIATEDLRRKMVAKDHASSSSIQKLIPAIFTSLTPSALQFDASTKSKKSKIKAINNRLDELCKRRVSLGLQTIPGATSTNVQQRPHTTCVPIEPIVYGRDEDKAKILEMVLRDEPTDDANFSVIPIVGMGGIGKTTLARFVYNDEAVQGFDLRAWVCVSDNFDVLRISKAILESITFSSCDLKDLNPVQVKLQEAVARKKILIVLDDVWSQDYGLWEILKSPFKAGAPGSKILVTTRHWNVASTMATTDHYNLELLSYDDCWSLFEKHACQSRDIGASQNLQLFRERVVEKCGGLPLVAKTLGGLLRSNQSDEWEHILNDKIWNLSDESGILPVLKLSYYHLPSHLKRCFAYCAILPKGYEFEEEELILLWIAEGLIEASDDDSEQMEDIGNDYFGDLLSRSIFQQSHTDDYKFVMHDLVNDLAQWASGETCIRLEDELGIGKLSKKLDKVRHSSYICGYYDGKHKFEVFQKMKHEQLRTFLPILLHDGSLEPTPFHYITNMVLSDLLPKLKRLRVLSLQGYYILELSNSIGGLEHLRYLNLSGTMIKCLPESTSSLFNLQTLMLRKCSRLSKLPSNMRNLINLRHLDISGENLIEEMPFGMKDLKCLQMLSNFIVGKGTGSGLNDLRSLNYLCGELHISRLENVTDTQDIREALLSDKEGLEELLLEWGSEFDHSRNEVVEKNVLDMLQPHTNLEELVIQCYGGTTLSSWIGDPSFSNMVVLRLENCKKCSALPSLGLLGALEELTIKGMPELKCIGSEFYGDGKSFQALEILCFEDLPEWKDWDPTEETEDVERFPCLCELSIQDCPKLSERLPSRLPSLEKLVVRNCSELVVSLSSVSMLRELIIDGCKRMVYSSSTELQVLKSLSLSKISDYGELLRQGFPELEILEVGGCEDMAHLWQNEISIEKSPQDLHSLTSLRCLRIEDCPSLVSFLDTSFFSNLKGLEIINCNALTSLPEGMRLDRVAIEGCHSLQFIMKDGLTSSMKVLEIKNCEKLKYLLDDKEHSCTSSSALQQGSAVILGLEIVNCPSLVRLSSREQLPESLQQLRIAQCPKLELISESFHNNSSLESIQIDGCENLKSIPKGLQNLRFLKFFCIASCPSLLSFPEGSLPNNLLFFLIHRCEKLKALPDSMHSIKSLQELSIIQFQTSLLFFPREGFPTNLTSLAISDPKLCKPLFDWGLHKLTSLRRLSIKGCSFAVSFPQEEIGMTLPSSLIYLEIEDFPKLKYLYSKGFQKLTNLKYLDIGNCPKLKHFPEAGFPSSLLSLFIRDSPLLEERCRRNRGKERSKIAHIPSVFINNRFVHAEDDQLHPRGWVYEF